MTKLSANLGFLWPELDLLDAIAAAKSAGFEAVEVHWPYITHAVEVAIVLEDLGMPLISLNTVGGDLAVGEFGLAALPGREEQARAAIDKAMAYAADVSARYVHVLAGKLPGDRFDRDEAAQTYIRNLRYASERGTEFGVGILIEPISGQSQPDYYLERVDQAADVIATVDADNVRILLDCFHTQLTEGQGNVGDRAANALAELCGRYLPMIGHIQIASVPERQEPDHGDVDYTRFLSLIDDLGYDGYVGAEYHPAGRTDDGLDWMQKVIG